MIIEFMTMMNTAKIDQYEEAQKIKIVINLSCSTFAHADIATLHFGRSTYSLELLTKPRRVLDFHKGGIDFVFTQFLGL